MKGFLDSIPDSLDGPLAWTVRRPRQVFWGIILPLAAPVLAVVGLLSFIFSINEFIIASRLLQSTDKFTLPVGLYGFINDKYAQQWGPFCAGVVLAAVPVIVLFFFLQRFIVEGLTRGAVKGCRNGHLPTVRTTTAPTSTSPSARRSRRRGDGAYPRPEGVRGGTVAVRYVCDGEPQVARATSTTRPPRRLVACDVPGAIQ